MSAPGRRPPSLPWRPRMPPDFCRPTRRTSSSRLTARRATTTTRRPAGCRSSTSTPRDRSDCRNRREDDPEAARGHDAAADGAGSAGAGGAAGVRGRARNEDRQPRPLASEPGPPSVPATEPRRVRALGPRPARYRRRRERVPAARHDERRLRQHRRRADVLGDADGRLPARRERRSSTWRSATATRARPK